MDLRDIQRDICLAVTGYFEQVKALGLTLAPSALEETVYEEFYKKEKPAGVLWNTWDDCINTIQDGMSVGVYMSLDALMYCDLEDVMAIVMDITGAVFRRVEYSHGQILQAEIEMSEEAVRKIQTTWRHVISDPKCAPCKHRLDHEFEILSRRNATSWAYSQ